jgi:hypothetical protein
MEVGMIREYLKFEKFIMPFALQVLFWSGIAGTLYGTWVLYSNGNWEWVMSLIFGTLLTRLIFESFILRYQTYIMLKEIRDTLSNG